jgi:hypothetical protein
LSHATPAYLAFMMRLDNVAVIVNTFREMCRNPSTPDSSRTWTKSVPAS